jgi:peptide-methionine (S)-S-oxide reductase
MTDIATFGAGCFWGVETVFRSVPGVQDAAVGYLGARCPTPTYEDVCTGRTGARRGVQVRFDPAVVSFDDLLTCSSRATIRPR